MASQTCYEVHLLSISMLAIVSIRELTNMLLAMVAHTNQALTLWCVFGLLLSILQH